MVYRVSMLPRAERDFAGIFDSIQAEEVEAARRWFYGLQAAILGLERFPKRCAFAPESRKLRQLLYGKKPHIYRVLFRVLERPREVQVVHIRHGAQAEFRED